ncbi:MAG: DNA-binding protein [Bacteroidales bacterium]|jgi:predicted histone-like DNA-binding protein|nr:DNA-binding protein [Bacteroidales bacterium]
MAATYDFKENPNPKRDGEKQPLHPRIVSKGTISSRDLLETIASGSTFTVGDIEGALAELEKKISLYLKEGYHVELGKLGFFSAKLKSRAVTDKNEIRASSIQFDNVNFRASSWFKKQIQGDLERNGNGFHASVLLSEAQRRTLLEKYLDTHAFITRTEYSSLTGVLKNRALKELKDLVNQGVLITKGKKSTLIFLRAFQQEVSAT